MVPSAKALSALSTIRAKALGVRALRLRASRYYYFVMAEHDQSSYSPSERRDLIPR